MATLLDYLDWFGDISFDEVPFCEVDALVLAQLSYVDLDGIVPTITDTKSVSVERASELFFSSKDKDQLYTSRGVINPMTPFVLQKMAAGMRFKDLKLHSFVSILDTTMREQLCAVSLDLDESSTFVAYRGTDETIAGWHEDLMMCFSEVQAQKDARIYLERLALKRNGHFMLSGHSKGGNLAVYAAAQADASIQKRIDTIWCMDSPGFAEDLPIHAKIEAIKDKIRLYIPEFCLVAALMDQDVAPIVVQSDAHGIFQHDALSWQVMGRKFVQADRRNADAQKLTDTINLIISEHDLKRRKNLTEAVYKVVQASGVRAIDEFKTFDLAALKRMKEQIDLIDPSDKEIIRTLIASILSCTMSNVVNPLGEALTQTFAKQEDPQEFSVEDFQTWKETKHLRSLQKNIQKIIEVPKRAVEDLVKPENER